jgi:hypothetical protein
LIAGNGCVDEYVTAGTGDVRSGVAGDPRRKSVPLGELPRGAGGTGETRSAAGCDHPPPVSAALNAGGIDAP